jgi:sugar phosphate isomerase/epimerase
MNTRRDFLKGGSAALLYGTASLHSSKLAAENKETTKYLDLPLGLELYSVREMLPTNYEGTLKQIAALGYREVEAAGFYNHSASQVKHAMQQAGLRCVSAHYSYEDLHTKLDQIVAFSKEIGLDYIVCPGPGHKDASHHTKMHPGQATAFTLEDWRWNAEQFNKIGEKVHAAGLKFGYHNHTREFKKQDGVTPYDELMRLTDPSVVTMEMDCGWVIVGGGNPIELLRRYPTRISMLHVKDFKWTKSSDPESSPPPATELGRGVIDYRPIFEAAARTGHIKHCFVEQEEFDVPPFQSLKIDADYMRKFHA